MTALRRSIFSLVVVLGVIWLILLLEVNLFSSDEQSDSKSLFTAIMFLSRAVSCLELTWSLPIARGVEADMNPTTAPKYSRRVKTQFNLFPFHHIENPTNLHDWKLMARRYHFVIAFIYTETSVVKPLFSRAAGEWSDRVRLGRPRLAESNRLGPGPQVGRHLPTSGLLGLGGRLGLGGFKFNFKPELNLNRASDCQPLSEFNLK